jgi:cold shock CspA family protein
MRSATHREKVAAAILAHRAATYGVRRRLDVLSLHEAGELLETALELAEEAPVELLADEPLDRLLLRRQQAGELASEAENYLAAKAKEYSGRLLERQRCVAPDSMSREVGSLKALKSDKGFGFVASRGVDYFAHYRDLVDPADWERLREGVSCAFDALTTERGPRASRLRVLE